jgi:hypothetical protein
LLVSLESVVFEEPPLWKAAAGFEIISLSCQAQHSGIFGLLALDGAAAFAFAGVLSLATLITGFAATLAFTGILSFAGVCPLFPHGLQRDAGLGGFAGCVGADR